MKIIKLSAIVSIFLLSVPLIASSGAPRDEDLAASLGGISESKDEGVDAQLKWLNEEGQVARAIAESLGEAYVPEKHHFIKPEEHHFIEIDSSMESPIDLNSLNEAAEEALAIAMSREPKDALLPVSRRTVTLDADFVSAAPNILQLCKEGNFIAVQGIVKIFIEELVVYEDSLRLYVDLINEKDSENKTPLIHAVLSKNSKLVKAVIELINVVYEFLGKSPACVKNAIDSDGFSALERAKQLYLKSQSDEMKRIIACLEGAKDHRPTKDGADD